MTVELSVADVRAALSRVAGRSAIGSGEAATLLLGRVFHEVFADLVSADPHRSGLPVIALSSDEPEPRLNDLAEHTWRRLVAPRLLRHAAELQTSSQAVLVLWSATRSLLRWLTSVVVELGEQASLPRGCWEELASWLQAEVPLACELQEPDWLEPVRLIGIADSILRAPQQAQQSRPYCAIELKLGRNRPAVDLGQAALYHLILTRCASTAAAVDATGSSLALMRFSPELEECVVEGPSLDNAHKRLIQLIGKLAGVLKPSPKRASRRPSRSNRPASTTAEPAAPARPAAPPNLPEPERRVPSPSSGGASPAASPVAGVPEAGPCSHDPDRYAELTRRLVRAYREHGVGVELRGPPLVGPRFVRCDVRLTAGGRVGGLRKHTGEVQLRLELAAEPLVIQEAGHLYVDLERPDKESVAFARALEQLPAIDPLLGSARIPVGVDSAGHLHGVDLGSAGRSHVLAAGTTGSGKSEWLRMMMAGLAATNTPDTLRFVTLDPKLAAFVDLERSRFMWKPGAWWIPGGERPASELFEDLVEEMDRRYQLTRQSGADNLREHVERTGKPLARIVCVCDEYFALVSQSKEEKKAIEEAVSLLGAKARAAGIHLVLATQQPSRQIINGAIQANLPCRVALALQSHIESTMILGARGAERLTGKGDLLYKDFGNPVRLQAPLLTADERAHWLGG